MTDAGDVYLADVGGGRRRRVLVLSAVRFHRQAGRAIIAPAVVAAATGPQPPWRIAVGPDLFALDMLRTIELDQLLESVGRADRTVSEAARRALRAIT
jgi:mRNA-degrading endonuclease toxin of MazEF toxin-antitoxin module